MPMAPDVRACCPAAKTMAWVLDSEALFTRILTFSDRKQLCATACVSRFYHTLICSPAGDALWRDLYRRHWCAEWVTEAQAEADEGGVAWRELYVRRHTATRDGLVGPLNTAIDSIRPPMQAWDDLTMSRHEPEYESVELTDEDKKLIMFNGHTFVYRDADWPPGGEEVSGPASGFAAVVCSTKATGCWCRLYAAPNHSLCNHSGS
jgi:hypothetical protein